MNNKGIIVSIIILVLLGGGVYFLMNQNSSIPVTPTTENNPGTTFVPTANNNENSTPPVLNSNTSVSVPVPIVSTPVTHTLSIQGFAFSQANLTIKKGDTVVWTNKDSMAHTVTGSNGGPSSGSISQNQTYSYTFNSTGTFPYHCSIHPSMTGTVTVTS